MKRFAGSRPWGRVLIAGGGFAALETLLALRALGDDWARIDLVAPEDVFTYRPAAIAQAFDPSEAREYNVGAIADDLDATYHQARLESVAPGDRYVRLSSGGRLEYDDLVLAMGTRARASVSGALTFRDQRDLPLFDAVLHALLDGSLRRLVFALPEGPSWPLPLYELALMSAELIAERGLDAEVTIVTPEPAPLAAFGPHPARIVWELLTRAGISFRGRSLGTHVRKGLLDLASGETVEADRVIAVPELRVPRIPGIPAKPLGFVPTDADGRVLGLQHVYAAGDMTTFPIKGAAIATQQADRIASMILSAGGAGIAETRTGRVLQARLLGGVQPLFLRAELDEHGGATSATLARPTPQAPIHEKVIARYLTPYLVHGPEAVSRGGTLR
jgi:sulfide:quinone oxidoreductase